MSEDYTPSMDRLRSAYVADRFKGWRGIKTPEQKQETNAEFDRAIAAHDKELRGQIAQEIEEARPQVGPQVLGSQYRDGKYDGMIEAASIALGEEQA